MVVPKSSKYDNSQILPFAFDDETGKLKIDTTEIRTIITEVLTSSPRLKPGDSLVLTSQWLIKSLRRIKSDTENVYGRIYIAVVRLSTARTSPFSYGKT